MSLFSTIRGWFSMLLKSKAKEEFNNMALNKESFNLHTFEKTSDLFEQLKIIYNNKRSWSYR